MSMESLSTDVNTCLGWLEDVVSALERPSFLDYRKVANRIAEIASILNDVVLSIRKTYDITKTAINENS